MNSLQDKTKLQQQLVTEQEAHERTLEAGNDRLLKMQNDLDEKLHLGKLDSIKYE